MKKYLFVLMCFLLTIISAGCSKDDDSNENNKIESCISGEIQLFINSSIEDYVSIVRLNMHEGNEEYNYIKAVVVPKEELPSRFYQDGVVIDFNITEVKSTFPLFQTGLFTPTSYLCSIELCK